MEKDKKKRVLNLYAGIGGNRKLWNGVEVTAIEYDKEIAQVYSDLYPDDEVIITDAHEYLLRNFWKYDFIWSSPPCPTHSRIRKNCHGANNPKYPSMILYEEILLLKYYYKGNWVVENVISFYEPLIRPYRVERHYFWSNRYIPSVNLGCTPITLSEGKAVSVEQLEQIHGISLQQYDIPRNKKIVMLRNCVEPKLGLFVFESVNYETSLEEWF